MKFKYSIWLCFLCAINIGFAQSPIKIQGVAYNRQGELLANATLFFQLKIHRDSLQGKVVWSDDFELISNSKAEYTIDLNSRAEVLSILQQKGSSYFIEESILRDDSNLYETIFFQELFFWNYDAIDTVAPVFHTEEPIGNTVATETSLTAVQPNEQNTTENDTAEEDMTEAELLEQEDPESENESETSDLIRSESISEETGNAGAVMGNANNGAGTGNGDGSKGELVSESVENALYLSVNKQEALPEGRVLHQMGNIGSTLYIVGGYNGKSYSKTCWSFDTKERFWKVLSPMSIARTEHQLHVINDQLVVLGGTDQSSSYVEVFDTSKNEWKSYAAPFEEKGSFLTEAYKKGVCWISEGNEKTKSKIHFFNSQSGDWTELGSSPEVGRVSWFGSVNGKLALVIKKQNQRLVAYQMEHSGKWIKWSDIPVQMNQAKLLNLGSDLYCIEADSKGKSEKYLLKLEAGEWVQKPAYALYRRDASIVCQNNRIVIIGGEGDQQRHMNLIEYYNPETEQWESSSRLLVGSSKQAACIIDQTIYISGGHSIKSFTSDRVESLQFY